MFYTSRFYLLSDLFSNIAQICVQDVWDVNRRDVERHSAHLHDERSSWIHVWIHTVSFSSLSSAIFHIIQISILILKPIFVAIIQRFQSVLLETNFSIVYFRSILKKSRCYYPLNFSYRYISYFYNTFIYIIAIQDNISKFATQILSIF